MTSRAGGLVVSPLSHTPVKKIKSRKDLSFFLTVNSELKYQPLQRVGEEDAF